jgi:hypothetical protein
MSIRFLDWRDFSFLRNCRKDTLFFYNALFLTAGPLPTLETILSSLVPLGGAFTLAYKDTGTSKDSQDKNMLIGQVIHRAGDDHAYLTFLAPESRLEQEIDGFFILIDNLIVEAGKRGTLHLLADVNEHSAAFTLLRQAGFSVYTRQRIWRISDPPPILPEVNTSTIQNWRPATSQDIIAIQGLFCNLVPALVQRITPSMTTHLKGLVFYQGDELQAYLDLRFGINGIYAIPLVHPNAEDAALTFANALNDLPGLSPRLNRNVYICVSHFQSWLESTLEKQGAESSPPQVLMTKHLTIQQPSTQSLSLSKLDQRQAKTFACATLGDKQYDASPHH